MGTWCLFTGLRFTRSQHRVWRLAAWPVVLLLCAGLIGLAAPTISAQTHKCASDVPPPVANPVPAQALPGFVLINEALSQPASNWNCSEPPGVFSQIKDSWIELYNPQNQAVDLYAAHARLSLNGGSTSALLPFGSAIAAGGFLVIFPLENQVTAPPASWNITLNIDGIIVDQAALPLLQPDQSYARVPDGATVWLYAGNPTIDASNNSTNQPPTSTPTKTPKATKTPGSSATTQPISSGTQPAWSQVQFPSDPAPPPTATANLSPLPSDQPQNTPPPQSNNSNGGGIALIVLFSLLLLGALAWCWRLFHAP